MPHDSTGNRAFSRRPEIALAVFGAFLSYTCGGCLSNEYVIPRAELVRLAQLPPEQRGQRVQVVQGLGDRRSEAIDTAQTPPPEPGYDQDQYPAPSPEGTVEGGVEPNVGVGVGVIIVPGPPLPLLPPLRPGVPGPGFVGGSGPGPRGLPASPMGRSAPAPRGASPGGGGKLGASKLGGGGGKDDFIALLVVVAVLATVGMVATEGTRYDGHVAMYPWQPVHLQDGNGQEREVPLAQMTPADAAASTKAVVMDDEGWGMLRLGRRPLDRKGFAFKMDGGVFYPWNLNHETGFGMDLQIGYFPHHRVGILLGWAFAAASGTNNNTYTRNDFALEAQVFPVGLWRLHPGFFGHVGVGSANTGNGSYSGNAFGGGVILELALTARLALTLRADHTLAQVAAEEGWASISTFTGGIAIY
jgi:hypothetical protein